MKKSVVVTEYQRIVQGDENKDEGGNQYVTSETFEQLENMIRANHDTLSEFMSYSTRNGEKVISAQNYVGVIAMKDGTQIEILPKIYRRDGSDKSIGLDETKKIFLRMLRTVQKLPFKQSKISSTDIHRMTMLEFFFRAFIDEVYLLIKRGLKAAYSHHCGNEQFYKGKLLWPGHIKRNLLHKERFYVRYDLFSHNRPENRLIKSTLMLLRRIAIDSRNRQDIAVLCSMFDEIPESKNYDADITKSESTRATQEYEMALNWCRVFLKKQSFTTFAGKNVAFAFLFPMEKVFESYVAQILRRNLSDNYQVSTQEQQIPLFDNTTAFFLKPDIVVREKGQEKPVILDTKWKILSDKQNKGIASSDMYQMYAYHHRYKAQKVILLYPQTNENVGQDEKWFIAEKDDKVNIVVSLVDLTDEENIAKKVQTLIKKDKNGSTNE